MKFNALMPELYVEDFEKSLNFYTNILGFKLEYQRYQKDKDNHFAFLSYFDAQLMIEELVPGEKEEKKFDPDGFELRFAQDLGGRDKK